MSIEETVCGVLGKNACSLGSNMIGGTVGGVLAVLILFIVAFVFIWYYKTRRNPE